MRGPGQPPPQRPAPINFPSARPCVWDRWVTAAWESPGHCPPPGRFFDAFSVYSNPQSPATGTDASKPPREEKLHADPGTGPKWTGYASLPGFGVPVLHPADIRPETRGTRAWAHTPRILIGVKCQSFLYYSFLYLGFSVGLVWFGRSRFPHCALSRVKDFFSIVFFTLVCRLVWSGLI